MTSPTARGAPSRRPSRSSLRGLLILPALLLAGACSRDSSGETIVFGFAGPVQTTYGKSTQLGAELAVKEINDAGGIQRRRIELRVHDDEASPERAIAVAHQLADDPAVVAVAGHVNSGAMNAAGPVYGERSLAALATTATSPLISQLGDWVFRVASSDSANAVELARHARATTPRTAILYVNDTYGRGLAGSFRQAFVAAGGTVVEQDPYLEDVTDFTPYLERLRRKGVGLIFIAGLEDGAARIIAQARAMDFPVRFLGGDGLEGLVPMGTTYDGTMVGTLYHPDASDEAQKFAQAFRRAYGREADGFAAAAYDAVRLLARAAERGGASRAGIREHLASVGRPSGSEAFEGATGTIRFDEAGDPTQKAFTVGVIRNGSVQLSRD